MPDYRIVMPIPLKRVARFEEAPWYLEDAVWIDTIYDEDFAAFHRDELPPYYQASVDIRTTCIYVACDKPVDFPGYAKALATQVEFVLNNFSTGAAIVVPYAVLLHVAEKSHVVQVADVEPIVNIDAMKSGEHAFREAVDASTVSTFYAIVRDCCRKDASLLFALDRFNSALIRSDPYDQIVDIAISLESLIPGTAELRYRFALNISFVVASTPEQRLEAFELLLALYDARSAIVHGDVLTKSAQVAIQTVEDTWQGLVQLARAALNYHVLFLQAHDRADWASHLRNLVFAAEARIVE